MYRIDYLLCNSDRAIGQRTGARRGRANGIKYGRPNIKFWKRTRKGMRKGKRKETK